MFCCLSTDAPDDVRARVVVILAGRDGPDRALESAVRAAGTELRRRVGPGGSVRVGVRLPDDPLSQTMGERGELEPVDAVIEATGADDDAPHEVATIVEGLGATLAGEVDATRSVVIAGRCYRFLSADGPLFIALAGFRDPSITMEQLSDWWLHRHGPLALSIVDPLPRAYEQLHAEQDASRLASEASGFPAVGYDMYDTIAIDSLESLAGSVMNPEVAVALYDDEVGHVDHARLRGAIQRTLD
jgi:EthD domain-containing protein